MICPICLKDKTDFERHHVVWRMYGGSNDKTNLLPICDDCHSSLTWDDTEKGRLRNSTCFAHQLARHGLSFLLKSNVIFSEHKTAWSEDSFLEKFKDISAEALDRELKYAGYQSYRENINKLNGTPLDERLPWEV